MRIRVATGAAEKIEVRRWVWVLAALATSVSCLSAQKPVAPGETPTAETAESAAGTSAEVVEQVPADGSSGDASGAAAEPTPAREDDDDGESVAPSTPDRAARSEPTARKTESVTPTLDPTDNAEWESRHVADRVPEATVPPGFRPRDRGVGWFQQSRERVRRQRWALWERVAEVRRRGPVLRSRGHESAGREAERRQGSAPGTSSEVIERPAEGLTKP